MSIVVVVFGSSRGVSKPLSITCIGVCVCVCVDMLFGRRVYWFVGSVCDIILQMTSASLVA